MGMDGWKSIHLVLIKKLRKIENLMIKNDNLEKLVKSSYFC